MTTLRIAEGTWDELQTYLDHPAERMAFLAATTTEGTDPALGDWTASDVMYLEDETDYAYQGRAGVELADHIRPRTLKWSSELDAALVEIHSHGASRWETTFSNTDLRGLTEMTPSLLWRLGGRPYGAIVVGGRRDHDSLWWPSTNNEPMPIGDIVIGNTATQPTGLAVDRLAKLHNEEKAS